MFEDVQARTEGFTDTNNNLQVSLQAPDDWNSGSMSATFHKLGNWRSYAAAVTNDDLNAFFVVTNLPSLADFVLSPSLISQSVTLNSQYDLNFNGYSGHAYSISVTKDQIGTLQAPIIPSIIVNQDWSAVLITTKQKGETHLIIYATWLGNMGNFQGIFENILNSLSFHPPVISMLKAKKP